MLWTILCISALALSAVTTALLGFKLFRDCDVRSSTVQWLFAVFFMYQCVAAATRLVFFIWLTIYAEQTADKNDGLEGPSLINTELHRLGTSAVLNLRGLQKGWVTATVIVGDTAHFGIAIWLFLLVYELSKLVALSMDRGNRHERAKIHLYAWIGHLVILLFMLVEIALAVAYSGYSPFAYIILLSVYALQTVALGYMIVTVVILKSKGRDYESVHGHFVASPLYRRLKWIMLVYALLIFQFYFSSVIMYATPEKVPQVADYAGVSFIMYYIRGFVLSVVTGCSQLCVIRYMHCCVPDEIHARFIRYRDGSTIPHGCDLPFIYPVFVCTDIESSSALWAIGDGRIMQEATQIHDDILRGLLAQHHGYEITTAGDSFQLAFHTILEAIEYCLEAQLQLLSAKWPKRLHGLVPATSKVRAGTKTIFRGLRVRMGIHDAEGSEGSLVRDVHVMTKKLIYTGASEVIAKEVGDLGAGGQILVTKRIAECLGATPIQLEIKCIVKPVCKYTISRLHTTLEVFQVVPKSLAARLESFCSSQQMANVSEEEARQDRESQVHQMYTHFQTPHGDRGSLYGLSVQLAAENQ